MTYREAAARGESLVRRIKRADQRARFYGLEDDGASDLAQRRRSLKDSVASCRRIIDDLKSGNPEYLRRWPRDPAIVAATIVRHEERIVSLSAELEELPAGILAPMTRRVAREDRRRKKRLRKETSHQHAK